MSVRAQLRREPAMTRDTILRSVRLTSALCSAASLCLDCHRAKIIHRDLKLENILLDKHGQGSLGAVAAGQCIGRAPRTLILSLSFFPFCALLFLSVFRSK